MKPIIPLLFALILLVSASIGSPARAESAAAQVSQARFQQISRNFAAKRKKLPRKDRLVAEDLLGMAAQLSRNGEYRDADFLLDRLQDLLAGRDPLGREPVRSTPAPSADAPLDGVQFTLADAFRNHNASGRKQAPAAEAAARVAPKITPFDEKNFDPVDRERFLILSQMLSDVEDTFRMHPNPETGEAVKNVRRFYYYLKKRGMGFPPEEEMEVQLESFMKEKVIKTRG